MKNIRSWASHHDQDQRQRMRREHLQESEEWRGNRETRRIRGIRGNVERVCEYGIEKGWLGKDYYQYSFSENVIGRHVNDGTTNIELTKLLFNELNVVLSSGRKFLKGLCLGDIALPTRDLNVFDFNVSKALLHSFISRHSINKSQVKWEENEWK